MPTRATREGVRRNSESALRLAADGIQAIAGKARFAAAVANHETDRSSRRRVHCEGCRGDVLAVGEKERLVSCAARHHRQRVGLAHAKLYRARLAIADEVPAVS